MPPSVRVAACVALVVASGWAVSSEELASSSVAAYDRGVHLRVNLLGYLPDDPKRAIVFSDEPIEGGWELVEAQSDEAVRRGDLTPSAGPSWGRFAHYYDADFSAVRTPGVYRLRLATGDTSTDFRIGADAFGLVQADLLAFMRQQRCGYNPTLDMACHRKDGRTAYGPRPAGSYVDASGGWHDAGDQLKYLITSSNATARMLLAYELAPKKFGDAFDELGRPGANGVADVLDEARWGLDWLHKMHPTPNELYHQVADDRDHNGWKWPNEDTSDYGWGPNSYRVAYAADGKPQGLREHKSRSTGVANLAGRYAAAMAMAARVWRSDLHDPAFAARCRIAAEEVYHLGKSNEGFQQGNSYGAPYRYEEDTWADDMEWGAAELFKLTGDEAYLEDAVRYARQIGATGWMPLERAEHYRYYPFVNVGHFALYPLVDAAVQRELAGYYREGIEHTVERAKRNAYGVGVPFIWCSNNLTTALCTQILLYERMTGDTRYHEHLITHRDWLLGRNPWGTSMFTGVPRDGEHPVDVHTSVWHLTRRVIPGGLVDGPVYADIYKSLKGIKLNEPDEFAHLQNDFVVYHDDIGDYSTNEPTMDGTAGAIWLMAHFGADDPTAARVNQATAVERSALTMAHGGIVRGPTDEKRLALVFTGGDHGEGAAEILQTLSERDIRASFFLTGGFLAQSELAGAVRRMLDDGHQIGPHGDAHLLYAPWDDRERSLVTEQQFKRDLAKNLAELRGLGAAFDAPTYFIPPYEWYNARHAAWAADLGCTLFNFTPGSGSHRDFAPEGHAAFRPSERLVAEILDHEATAPDGLNGHLLLLHLGSQRQDKVPPHLGELLDELAARGYTFARVDELLGDSPGG
ncbi:MAG: glycoside hydrolase family 9 protein [Planctomycetota bacterium]